MVLGALWVAGAVLIALVLLVVALVVALVMALATAVTVGAIVWGRRRFRRLPPSPLGHRPHGAAEPVSAPRTHAMHRPPAGEIVDIEAREIPDPPPGRGR